MALMTKHNIVYYEAPVRLLLLILICSLVLVKKFISIAGVMIKFISIKTSEQEKMPPQATSYPCTPTETPLKWDLHSATDIFIFAI